MADSERCAARISFTSARAQRPNPPSIGAMATGDSAIQSGVPELICEPGVHRYVTEPSRPFMYVFRAPCVTNSKPFPLWSQSFLAAASAALMQSAGATQSVEFIVRTPVSASISESPLGRYVAHATNVIAPTNNFARMFSSW